MTPDELVARFGGRFSEELGIDLRSGNSAETFKWLLAAMLFGARISWKIAEKTWRRFERHDVLAPEAILKTGWHGLVAILDEGGYVRYDFKTATKLLEAAGNLESGYGGNLNLLHSQASDPAELERKLIALAKGVGPITVGIFLREMRGLWEKAQPLPSEKTVAAAKALGFVPENVDDRKEALELLLKACGKKGLPDFESALLRWARKRK